MNRERRALLAPAAASTLGPGTRRRPHSGQACGGPAGASREGRLLNRTLPRFPRPIRSSTRHAGEAGPIGPPDAPARTLAAARTAPCTHVRLSFPR